MTDNYNYFYWWSDIPVYKREHLKDFFSKISKETMYIIPIPVFGHMAYLNYLMIYH